MSLVFLANAGTAIAAAQAPAPIYNPTNPQPRSNEAPPTVQVGADHRVTFRLSAPEAKTVTVNGDFRFGAGPATLVKDADGVWSFTTDPIEPDSYTYNFTVDGVMVLDTRSQTFRDTPNALFNYFDMPGPSTDFMALKDVPHGRVEAVIYHSSTLNMERRMHVYLPPNVQTIPGKLAVLYLLHGVGDNDISWTSAGKINLILDNLYAEGKLKNMIVVMPSGHVPNARTRVFSVGPDDPFSQDFLHDLMPYIEKNYPVSTRREDTAIAGFSMGGGQTLNLALWFPEKFGYVYPISTGYFPDGVKEVDAKYGAVLDNVAKHPYRQFIFGRGKDDKLTAVNTQATIGLIEKHHIPHQLIEMNGQHSFVFARRFLLAMFPQMFR